MVSPLLLGIIPFFIHSLSKDLMAAGVIILENISKSFGTHIVLKDINMSFEKGKHTALLVKMVQEKQPCSSVSPGWNAMMDRSKVSMSN